ncbi:hypothetical protein QWY90_01550 [Flavobacterium paronense]|nr:hypothetical protein [Flavobacterium paronense]MDN3675993.1 hypothetical protein [Flavobacterium paronense]
MNVVEPKEEVAVKSATQETAPTVITDNLFTSVKLYKINGDEIQSTDTIPNMSGIKLNLVFSLLTKITTRVIYIYYSITSSNCYC